MKINLTNLKIVLFDFDNTLCIHNEHKTKTSIEFETDILKYGEKVFCEAESNTHMKAFIDLCIKHNICIGLISTTKSCKRADEKLKWAQLKYNTKFHNYCVGTQEAKLEMMEALANASGYTKDEIAIVDDYWYQLNRANNAGFRAYSPMQIVNFIEENANSN